MPKPHRDCCHAYAPGAAYIHLQLISTDEMYSLSQHQWPWVNLGECSILQPVATTYRFEAGLQLPKCRMKDGKTSRPLIARPRTTPSAVTGTEKDFHVTRP